MSFNITGIYDQTYVIDTNVFGEISIIQTGLSSLNNSVFNNYTEFINYSNTTNNKLSDLNFTASIIFTNLNYLSTYSNLNIENLKITSTTLFNDINSFSTMLN